MRSLVLALLVLASLPPEAAGAAGPPRAGLALKVPPVETLLPAETAVPDALEDIARHNLSGRVPTRNGFVRSLPRPRPVRLSAADLLRPTPFELAGGVVTRSSAGGLVWSGEVAVEGAHALRLHLSAVSLPPGSRVWTYAPDGSAVELAPERFAGSGGIWTGVTFGNRVWLEVEIPASGLAPGAEARFTPDRVLERVGLDADGRPIPASELAPKTSHCFVELPCAQADFPAQTAHYRLAVTLLEFVQGGFSGFCTGALMNDTDEGSRRPYVLTANHCIPDQATAVTVAARFRFWNQGCGGGPSAGDQVVGAALRATGGSADFTLIELARLPPKPEFLDWARSHVGPGAVLSLLSHARGRPQVFSRHRVIAPNGCNDPTEFFMTETVYGGAGPGASGAPVVDDRGRVVGTVHGGCGPSPGDGCNPATTVVFGRFSTAFSALRPFLAPEPEEEPPPDDGFLRTDALPGFKFRVEITGGGGTREGTKDDDCIPETLCVSGAIPGRSEVFVRIVGPKPNGKLWPTLVKFTTSRVEVTIVQEASGEERRYVLEGAAPGTSDLPGLFDRGGFDP